MTFTKVEKKAILQIIAVGLKAKNINLSQSALQNTLRHLNITSQTETQELERMSIFSEMELFTILTFDNSIEKSLLFQKILKENNL